MSDPDHDLAKKLAGLSADYPDVPRGTPRQASDLNRALDTGLGLTTLPSAGDVWWVDDCDDVRDAEHEIITPHEVLRRLRRAQEEIVSLRAYHKP
jgi:hypothetical protein